MKAYEAIAATPLPQGYDRHVLFLRRWLLDLRSRIAQLPRERQRMLEARVNDFYPKNRRAGHGSRETNSHLLANAGR